MTEGAVELFRPLGPAELELVASSGYRRWPPRLPGQAIFYPVAEEEYAKEITVNWNIPAAGAGFVARFCVKQSFMDRYPTHPAGGKNRTEWWIPAEALEELNDNILGLIEIVGEYR